MNPQHCWRKIFRTSATRTTHRGYLCRLLWLVKGSRTVTMVKLREQIAVIDVVDECYLNNKSIMVIFWAVSVCVWNRCLCNVLVGEVIWVSLPYFMHATRSQNHNLCHTLLWATLLTVPLVEVWYSSFVLCWSECFLKHPYLSVLQSLSSYYSWEAFIYVQRKKSILVTLVCITWWLRARSVALTPSWPPQQTHHVICYKVAHIHINTLAINDSSGYYY